MLSTSDFRRIALGFPESLEGGHFDVADFRVRGRIFATLRATDGRVVLKLAPDQQQLLMETAPGMFNPVAGAWGVKGWTRAVLDQLDEPTLRHAMTMAWKSVAPKKLRDAAGNGRRRSSSSARATPHADAVICLSCKIFSQLEQRLSPRVG